MPPEICPNCGAEVPPHAKACPECGSCDETGWSERAQAQHLDLPDDAFDYQDFVRREFASQPANAHRVRWYWWLVAAVMVVALLAFFLRPLLRW